MNKKTYYNPSLSQLEANWRVVDAKNRVLGRLATGIARTLMGKEKPGYVPHMMNGDFVIVINSRHIKLTGRKSAQKQYIRHSGRPGGRKEIPFETTLAKHPERVVRAAVKGMLPKTKLGARMLRRLNIYPDAEHPHEAQVRGQEMLAKRREAEKESAEQEQNHPDESLAKPEIESSGDLPSNEKALTEENASDAGFEENDDNDDNQEEQKE